MFMCICTCRKSTKISVWLYYTILHIYTYLYIYIYTCIYIYIHIYLYNWSLSLSLSLLSLLLLVFLVLLLLLLLLLLSLLLSLLLLLLLILCVYIYIYVYVYIYIHIAWYSSAKIRSDSGSPGNARGPRGPGIMAFREAQPVVVTQQRNILPHHQPRIAYQPGPSLALVVVVDRTELFDDDVSSGAINQEWLGIVHSTCKNGDLGIVYHCFSPLCFEY